MKGLTIIMSIFDYAIASIAKLNEPWGIKDKDSKHIFMNHKARVYTNTPSGFSIENKRDDEFPVDWSEYSQDFILHDRNTIRSNQSVSVMEVHNWNGQDTSVPFVSTKFPIYNLDGNCIGLLWNAKPVNFINPFIKSILKKSVIQLNCETPFSMKEQDVIFLLMNGFTRKEIANLLKVAIRTVEGRIYSFMAKRSLSNLSQLRDFYIENAENFRILAILLKKGIFFMSKDFETTPVPNVSRQGLLGLALVHAGMLTALDQFMLGAVLGDGMSISKAFIEITIASLIFAMMTCGIGYIGMKEGLSGTLIAKHYGFGKYGTAFIGLLISISLVGWFGVQNALFAKGINHFFHNNINDNYLVVITGLTITSLVSFGFGALKTIAKIAVPVFIIVIFFISFGLVKSNFTDFSHMVSSGNEKISISEAITMIIGGAS
jgi:DNA-binding CsgD family transcriptional regulator